MEKAKGRKDCRAQKKTVTNRKAWRSVRIKKEKTEAGHKEGRLDRNKGRKTMFKGQRKERKQVKKVSYKEIKEGNMAQWRKKYTEKGQDEEGNTKEVDREGREI